MFNGDKTHCNRGHEFTAENTYRPSHTPEGLNWRGCKRCKTLNRVKKGSHTELTENQVKNDSCKKGHLFTPENTIVNKTTGYRCCRACDNERQRARYRKVASRTNVA